MNPIHIQRISLLFLCISWKTWQIAWTQWQSGGGKIQEGLRPGWMNTLWQVISESGWGWNSYINGQRITINPGGHKSWGDLGLMLRFARFLDQANGTWDVFSEVEPETQSIPDVPPAKADRLRTRNNSCAYFKDHTTPSLSNLAKAQIFFISLAPGVG